MGDCPGRHGPQPTRRELPSILGAASGDVFGEQPRSKVWSTGERCFFSSSQSVESLVWVWTTVGWGLRGERSCVHCQRRHGRQAWPAANSMCKSWSYSLLPMAIPSAVIVLKCSDKKILLPGAGASETQHQGGCAKALATRWPYRCRESRHTANRSPGH